MVASTPFPAPSILAPAARINLPAPIGRNDDLLLWASIGTGYKSGGINVGFGSQPEFNIYDEETILSYEGGFKWTFWEGKARLNASAFFYDYEDIQIFDQTSGVFGLSLVIDNAPEAEYYGFDAEFATSPIEGLDLQFGLAYLETEFLNLRRPITGADLSGNSNVYAPQWKTTGLARYEVPTPALFGGRVAGSFDWSWTDEVFHTIENRNDVRGKSRWLVGGRLSWFSADDKLELAVWGRNLSNSAFRVQTFDFSPSGWHTSVPNRPRSFGGEVVYTW